MWWIWGALAAPDYLQAAQTARASVERESVDQVLYRQAREQLHADHLHVVRSLLKQIVDPERRELLTRLLEVEAVALGYEDDLPLLTVGDPGVVLRDYSVQFVWSDRAAMFLAPERRSAAMNGPPWTKMAAAWIARDRPDRAAALLDELNALDRGPRSQIHAQLAANTQGDQQQAHVRAAARATYEGGWIETGADELEAMVALFEPLSAFLPADHPVFDELAQRIAKMAERRSYEDDYDPGLTKAQAFYAAHSALDPWYQRSLLLEQADGLVSTQQRLRRARARRECGDTAGETKDLEVLRKSERVAALLDVLYPEHADLLQISPASETHWAMLDAARERGVDTATLERFFERPAAPPPKPPAPARYRRNGAGEVLLKETAARLDDDEFDAVQALMARWTSAAIEDDDPEHEPSRWHEQPYWAPRSGRLRQARPAPGADFAAIDTSWMMKYVNSERLFETSLETEDDADFARIEALLRKLIADQRPAWRDQNRQHLVGLLVRRGKLAEAEALTNQLQDFQADPIRWVADDRLSRGLNTPPAKARSWIEALQVAGPYAFPSLAARRAMAAANFGQPPSVVRANLDFAARAWAHPPRSVGVELALLHGAAFGGLEQEADELLDPLVRDLGGGHPDSIVVALLEARESGYWRPDVIATLLPRCHPQTWDQAMLTAWAYDDQATAEAWWTAHPPEDLNRREDVWRTLLQRSSRAPDPVAAVWTLWDPEPTNLSHLREQTAALAAALESARHPDAAAVAALVIPAD